jgi:hypothetical protein
VTSERFQAQPVLDQLKDFQQASVDHAYTQLYKRNADRFLVADEVGLGKTMVARGVIAKAIEALWDDVPRIDIIYICSNASIAQQNIRRLNVMPDQGFSFSSRMTMIARDVAQLQGNKVNFVSFTPGTSFDLKSNTGMSSERVLLYWLLRHIWGRGALTNRGGKWFFKCSVSDANWPRYLKAGKFERSAVDRGLLDEFAEDLIQLDAQARFEDLMPAFAGHDGDEGPVARHGRDLLIGQLRERLAKRCVDALEPDLVILDEFQRFRHLMSGEDAAGELAKSLFSYKNNKTLLLSATPYKMFTSADDEDDNHHQDFLDTIRFLFNGQPNRFEAGMAEFRAGILDVHHRSVDDLRALRRVVESELSKVMVRTERLGAGGDRNGMLEEILCRAPLETSDVTSYVALARLAKLADAGGMVEYWKSVPAFLNFSDGYKAGERIADALRVGDQQRTARHYIESLTAQIDWGRWRRFDELEGGNARYRILREQTVENEAWRMLWLAPSLPYHSLAGPWAAPERAEFTKRLIFSSWVSVPKSVSSLLSYDAERRIFGLRPEPMKNTPEARQAIRGLLPFRRDLQGRPGAMNSFAFVYPCATFAEIADPLAIARELGRPLELEELRSMVRSRVATALGDVEADFDGTVVGDDLRWYWAAPILIDSVWDAAPSMAHKTRYRGSWVGGSAADGDEGEMVRGHAILDEHIDLAAAMYRGEISLGRKPDDLVEVLVDMALGAPATAGIRALARAVPEASEDNVWHAACRVGWAFRALFNLPDVNTLVRSAAWDQEYWRSALRYCVDGCLTAVLDEYLHLTRESILPRVITQDEADEGWDWDHLLDLTNVLDEAAGIRTASLVASDHLGELDHPPRFRTRYAMRFGNERSETETSVVTATHLRRAFNSPFWPFVLTSTSVGQEGLDFHSYCHAIMHWNLPGNPVDLEQREGRIHRFKGHAVRRNVAERMAEAAWAGEGDPWKAMFGSASSARADGDSELVPYWIYPGRAKIERHVPMLPMSREVGQLARLKRDVARYRLVFGQPRQDDLLEYLGEIPEDKLAELRIDLSPRSWPSLPGATVQP